MNRNIKFTSAALILVFIFILFQPFIVYGVDSVAYNDGYSNGLWEGRDAAYEDLEDVKSKNFRRLLPKDSEIESRFDLDKETTQYKRDFKSGYKSGFEKGYNDTYDNPQIEIIPTNYDEMIGYEMGKAAGLSDFYANKNNKWALAVPSTTKILNLFDLKKETNAYKNAFVIKFKSKFQDGYEFSYRQAKFEPTLNDLKRGEEDGKKIGELLGENNGKKDYYDGSSNKWDRDLLSDKEIESIFALKKEVNDYKNSFISSFKRAYQEQYNEGYRNGLLDYENSLFKDGHENGNKLGNAKGYSTGKSDFIMGKPNSVDKHNFTDENIINEYQLHNESQRYRDAFIGGFKEGFKEGYIESYQDNALASFSEKIAEETISIGGGEVLSGDGRLKLAIDAGTFYNDIIVSIDKYTKVKNTITLLPDDRYTSSSDLYLLKIDNPTDKYNDDKDIIVNLDYYGGLNGGLYRYHYGHWQYVPSVLTENSLTAYINPKSLFENAVYGVFIDEKATYPLDIRGHWAKDEIITAIRREYAGLYNDNTFRADTPLTTAQLLLYLSWANNWKVEANDDNLAVVKSLKDYNDIKDIEELVAYGIGKGYFHISAGNKFNKNNTVSYKELEKIIQKVYDYKDFGWEFVSDKMARLKDKRCSSNDSTNNKVTRAEFAYLLNLLK
ncbi:MAG: S-layer homology domain-containing protein [Firmicutes bacterium]|nr:S-layer homology domain-containing protein [Bacillota bacterium]